jgi:hypothetical protein
MRPHRRRQPEDRGSTVIETVIVLPLVILLSMAALQVAMVVHARDVGATTARVALDRARVVDATAQDGESAAHQFLAQGDDGLIDPQVDVDRGSERVTVTVTSEVLSLVPAWRPSITSTVSAPTERLIE